MLQSVLMCVLGLTFDLVVLVFFSCFGFSVLWFLHDNFVSLENLFFFGKFGFLSSKKLRFENSFTSNHYFQEINYEGFSLNKKQIIDICTKEMNFHRFCKYWAWFLEDLLLLAY